MSYAYKFENFKYADFPVFSSVQSGAGTIVVPHFHKAVELLLVLRGECEVRVDTAVLHPTMGDVLVIPPYCVHTVIGKNSAAQIKGITFEPSILERANELSAALDKQNVATYRPTRGVEELRTLILAFSLAGEDKSASFRFGVLSKLYQIGEILLNNYPVRVDNCENERLRAVFSYIEEQYTRQIRVEDLSALVNVCDDHFIRLFKKATGKSPVSYINDRRLERALQLLVDSDLTVTEIADAVGFSNVNYMIKLFKRAMNTTPLAYRKTKAK
jgi:AraC-like DNA-binding protein